MDALLGDDVDVLVSLGVEKDVAVLLAVRLPVAVLLAERDEVGVTDAVAVLVTLGVDVVEGVTDAVPDALPVRLCVAVALLDGVPVALRVAVREPDDDAVGDRLDVGVMVIVAVVLLDAPTERVLVPEAVTLPVTLAVPALVELLVAEAVLVELVVAVCDGCRMHMLTSRTASASPLDGRTPMVMLCMPLRSNTRERTTQPVAVPLASTMSAVLAFQST